ncbi:MAG: hypothetical protein QW286_03085 [Candidatus Aenigmatarchaeota archaeon]
MKNKKPFHSKETNIWKLVSAVFILLFVFVLVLWFFSPRPRPAFIELTQEQKDIAKAIVTQDMQARGENISTYEIFVTNRAVGFIGKPRPDNFYGPRPSRCPEGICRMESVQVLLHTNSTSYLYIVDINKGKILMRSFTEWLND